MPLCLSLTMPKDVLMTMLEIYSGIHFVKIRWYAVLVSLLVLTDCKRPNFRKHWFRRLRVCQSSFLGHLFASNCRHHLYSESLQNIANAARDALNRRECYSWHYLISRWSSNLCAMAFFFSGKDIYTVFPSFLPLTHVPFWLTTWWHVIYFMDRCTCI